MNPREYEERYHNLVVSLDGHGTTTVDVHRYQNNDAKLKANDHLGNREALKHKDQVVGKLDAEVRQHRKAAAAKLDPKEIEAFLTPAEPLIREVGPVLRASRSWKKNGKPPRRSSRPIGPSARRSTWPTPRSSAGSGTP